MTIETLAMKLHRAYLGGLFEGKYFHADWERLHHNERAAWMGAARCATTEIKGTDLSDCPIAIMDTRDLLGICAPTEDAFLSLYALQGHRVALVDLGMPDNAEMTVAVRVDCSVRAKEQPCK